MEKTNSENIKKNMMPIIISSVLALGVGFFGGMKYQSSEASVLNPQDFQNLTPEQRQARFSQMGQGRTGANSGRRMGGLGGGVNGEVLSKDDKSITVKLQDGGSKIVFFSTSTRVMNSTEGSLGDLQQGKIVIVNGKTNSDGSVIADSIQIRSAQIPSSLKN